MRDEGGLARPACAAADCDFVLWENPVPVVAALVEYAGQTITGYLERDETPDTAVAREVAEELGLSAHSVSLIGLYNFAPKNQLIIAYHVLACGQIVLNEELAEFKLIEPSKLKAWEFGTGPAVRDWLASRSAQ